MFFFKFYKLGLEIIPASPISYSDTNLCRNHEKLLLLISGIEERKVVKKINFLGKTEVVLERWHIFILPFGQYATWTITFKGLLYLAKFATPNIVQVLVQILTWYLEQVFYFSGIFI